MTNPILVSCLYLPLKLSSPVHNFLLLLVNDEDDEGLMMALAGEDGPRRDDVILLIEEEDDSAGAFNTQSNRCSQNSWNQGFRALVMASGFNAK